MVRMQTPSSPSLQTIDQEGRAEGCWFLHLSFRLGSFLGPETSESSS